MKSIASAMLCLVFLSACSGVGEAKKKLPLAGGEEVAQFVDQPAKGQINGQPWKFVSGKAMNSTVNGKSVLMVTLWDDATTGNPCARMQPSTFMVTAFAPVSPNVQLIVSNQEVPGMILGDERKAGDPANNIWASKGMVQFTSVTPTAVAGKISGIFGNSQQLGLGTTNVNGTFQVPFCQ